LKGKFKRKIKGFRLRRVHFFCDILSGAVAFGSGLKISLGLAPKKKA
jgi:hypothetical protein